MRRIVAPGLAAAAVYLGIAAATWPAVPALILYEGFGPPPPYHWVKPPPDLASGNQPAPAGAGRIALTPAGSRPASIATEDAQAVAVFPEGAVDAQPGQTWIDVRLTPLDPATLGSPPRGFRYDGNAYRIEAAYAPSGRAAPLRHAASVIMRYPVHADEIFRRDGQTWTPLKAEVVQATLQVFGSTAQLGVFVAAARL
jgi:hypothetical protein